MSTNVELYLPERHMLQDGDLAIHEELAATSLDDFINDMSEHVTLGESTDMAIRAVDLLPAEAEPKRAIVLPMSFGNGYNPSNHIRARAIQRFMPEDTRLVIFPNNTKQLETYNFKGNKDPIEQLGVLILRACNELGIEEIAISGYSQAASVGAVMLSRAENYDIAVGAASLGDPANVVERTKKELKEDFVGKNLSVQWQNLQDLNRAINNSGIPALSETQHSRGGLDAVRQLIMFAGVNGNAKILANDQLYMAMTHDTFGDYIAEAVASGIDPSLITVSAAENSKISKGVVIDALNNNTNVRRIPGYGHEACDNIIDLALGERIAFTRAGFYQAA